VVVNETGQVEQTAEIIDGIIDAERLRNAGRRIAI